MLLMHNIVEGLTLRLLGLLVIISVGETVIDQAKARVRHVLCRLRMIELSRILACKIFKVNKQNSKNDKFQKLIGLIHQECG